MNITYDSTYNGMDINASSEKGYGCRTDILDRYQAHLEDMCSKHNKVHQQRFDLHFPKEFEGNEGKTIIRFTNRLTQDLKRNYKAPEEGKQRSSGKKSTKHSPDPRLILVREFHGNSQHRHIHGVLLVNGNSYKSELSLFNRVNRQWNNALGVSSDSQYVHHPNTKGQASVRINKNADDCREKINAATKQATYLGKVRGKENLPKGSWLINGTRLPKSMTSKGGKTDAKAE